MNCSCCKFFDYDETWDGEEEYQYFMCHAGNNEHIGFDTPPCDKFICSDDSVEAKE